MRNLIRLAAGALAHSPLLLRGRRLYQQNSANFLLPMSKLEKLICGLYLILEDYRAGIFPPRFSDQAKAYQAEIDYGESMPGVSQRDYIEGELRKPFWNKRFFGRYARSFERLLGLLEWREIRPPGRLLELGCGSGWMGEFLALTGYTVVGTTVSPRDVKIAEQRIEVLKTKQAAGRLSLRQSPMEAIDRTLADVERFDAAFVFEALHHAFDWRQAIHATSQCLKEGGVFIIANEPNVLHTFISYRVARLTHTHEIGMSRRQLCRQLAACGFARTWALRPLLNDWVSPHWIVARKQ